MKINIRCTAYHHAVGGSRVMHLLAYYMHKLGHTVDAGPMPLNPDLGDYSQFIPDPDLIILHEIDDESFPDEKVVRWVTYYPHGFGAGPKRFPKNEYVVSFAPEYLESARAAAPHQAEIPVFGVPTCDLPGLEEKNVARDSPAAFWRGKGPDVQCPERHVAVTRMWPETRRQLVRLLKGTKRFYSADKDTGMLYEAQLCGCQVFLWDEARRAFLPWSDPDIYRFKPWTLEEGMMMTEIFLDNCFINLGLEC